MTLSSISKRLLVACGALVLASCGGSSSDTPASTPESKPVEKVETPAPTVKAETPAKPAPKPEASVDPVLKRGRIVWFKCRSCHELGPDGPHKVGPNLNGLIGAKAAQKEGFVYSDAMANSGVIWDEAALDAFIKKPTDFIKGTKMAFVGISKESDRQAVIEYIRQEAKAPD